MLRRIVASTVLLTLLSAYASPLAVRAAAVAPKKAAARASKLAPEFEAAGAASELVRVIIQTKGRPSAAHADAVAAKGGAKGRSFEALDAMTALVPRGSLAALAAREDVAYISPDRLVKGSMALTREATGASLAQAGFDGAPGLTGKGIGIAVIDSGISSSHPDFQKNGKSRVAAALDFTGGGAFVRNSGILWSGDGILWSGDGILYTGDGVDREGHGTGVASVAAGNGAASAGYGQSFAGIAPEATLIDLKVLDDNGVGTTSAVLGAINWAIANRQRYNIRVLNLSLGSAVRESYKTDPVCKAVERAVRAGLVVVAAAGNDGRTEEIVGHDADGSPVYRAVYGAVHSPGNSPYAITVGACDTRGTARRSDDRMAQFSSKGPTAFDNLPKPELVAPGRGVVAAMSQDNPHSAVARPDRVARPDGAGALQNAYYSYYGTSFSAPVVSGTVALMLEANRSLTPALVRSALTKTANALPDSLFPSKAANVLTQGVGEVNAAAAVEMARAFVPNADKLKSGQLVFRAGTAPAGTFEIGGETVKVSTRVMYADGVLFNQKPVFTNGILLAEGILLLDGLLLSDGILWSGDGILWSGDGILWSGDGILWSGDGILWSGDGILLAEGILWSGDGILWSGDGILWSGDGILYTGDGILLAEGILYTGDGILYTGDGILLDDARSL